MILTNKELQLIKETDFLITKIKIISEIEELFGKIKNELLIILDKMPPPFPEIEKVKTGKVYKGENYKDLPFVNLDLPNIFKGKNAFAYRTMFWWGNFFSSTLHLQGEYLEYYRDKFISDFDLLIEQNLFIGIDKTPWEYHYGKDNYTLLTPNHKEFVAKCSFLKLSKKIELEEIEAFPRATSDLFAFFLSILNK